MELQIAAQRMTGGLITRFLTNLRKSGKEKITPSFIDARIKLLESYWATFWKNHSELHQFPDLQTDDYVKNGYFEEVEEAFLHTKTVLLEAGQTAVPQEKQPVATAAPLPLNLPKLSLPRFSGELLHWETFRDIFTSMVHDVPSIPDVLKLQYLKTSVSGEAAQLLKGIAVSAANYDGAWQLLVKRYGNPRVLLSTHLNQLLSAAHAQRENSTELKRLIDTFDESCRALKTLERPVNQWDDWLIHLLVGKLDSNTRKDWETSLPDATAIPTYVQLSAFIENRIRALEATKQGPPAGKPLSTTPSAFSKPKTPYPTSHLSVVSDTKSRHNLKCHICNGSHFTGYCSQFNRQPPLQRWALVNKHKLCANCLRDGHPISNCPSDKRCNKCHAKHHSMMHSDHKPSVGSTTEGPVQRAQGASTISEPTTATPAEPNLPTTSNGSSTAAGIAATYTQQSLVNDRSVLLATALVKVRAPSGMTIVVRALLDQGSDTSFATERLVQQLRLARIQMRVPVTGMGGTVAGTAKSAVQFTLHAVRENSLSIPLTALVLKTLTRLIPSDRVPRHRWPHLADLELADPTYDKSAKVDLLLGADTYGLIIQPGLRIGAPGTPIAQKTSLGWIISGLAGQNGQASSINECSPTCLHCTVPDPISDVLQQFWTLEELQCTLPPTEEDQKCEQHFVENYSRLKDGRYQVRLPCKIDAEAPLSDSRRIAINRLHRVEAQLRKDPDLALKYTAFMCEYYDLGHMSKVECIPSEEHKFQTYYMPHHAVLKPHDPTKKLRVVFNASQKTATGCSLNDRLLVGPKLQSELWAILTAWRQHRFVFSTDIVKMYRQIRVHPLDQPLQRIVWRSEPSRDLTDFQLSTVTYGTACAPFLALRVLRQLALDESEKFPRAANILVSQSYIDDLFAGADSIEEITAHKAELIGLLSTGGFSLSKWASNLSSLVDSESSHVKTHDYNVNNCVSTLGLRWDTKEDIFLFKVELSPIVSPLSKRQLLSEIARLFDPLGWLSPVLIFAKIMLQNLWLSGIDWDSPIPKEQADAWNNFRGSLTDLERITVPRWFNTISGDSRELHGFCDASERAYAALVYLSVVDTNGTRRSTLVVAKSKVAPVKTCSIPRLELCGAVLLSKLLPQVAKILNLPDAAQYAWTDSTVTLSWLRSHASRWKPFVANRVSTVQTNLPHCVWRHVPTSSNPADKATRGISPLELRNCRLWWYGPIWLSDPLLWPTLPSSLQEPPANEARPTATVLTAQISWLDTLIQRHSRYTSLVRVLAYCIRFINNTQKVRDSREIDYLTSREILKSHTMLLRHSQVAHFNQERADIALLRPISRRSPLRNLNPFLDGDGLLRVGGRLHNSCLNYNEKHPVIIHKNSNLAPLIISQAHLDTLHGGPQLTLSHLLRQFWIIGGRPLVRSITHSCGKCARFRIKPQVQLMGQLPRERVTAERPFLHTGVDYAGPIAIRTSKGRGQKAHKGYFCVFVCLATRAVHLEAVSDYSSSAFLAAFARFVSRRGRPAVLYSDNGTTFTGADNQLRELFNEASAHTQHIAEALAMQHTDWKFIPPHAPHFGGIWEAGVKAVKHHLRRTIGDTTLTFEELTTLLSKVEACLNSRPLHPLSSDPNDLTALTPGHFLIGSPLTAIPEPSLLEIQHHLLTRWQLLSHMRDLFWHRWSKEYLHHLQERCKWQSPKRNLKIGDLVLVKSDILPPTKWNLARIIDLHPGADNLVRVATVRTSTSTLKRPITKLCLLPASTD